MRARGWITFAIMVVAVAAFARYLLARQESAALRAEIALLQQENDQVARLRAEHERLRAAKISDAELERLRSDRAALARLRAEINALEESAERKASRAQGETASKALPPLVLNLAMAGDGGWLIDGSPADQNALRQLLTDVVLGLVFRLLLVHRTTLERDHRERNAVHIHVLLGEQTRLGIGRVIHAAKAASDDLLAQQLTSERS
jgi:hypothetical protein